MNFVKSYTVVTALSCFFAISVASFLTSPQDHHEASQQRLLPDTESWVHLNFSVGFSLQSSYGAAAVIFEGLNGELRTYTTVYQTGFLYNEVMSRLSLESSMHRAPPYESDGDWVADQPRRAARTAMKAIGLPTTYDSQLESSFSIQITEAVFTCTHLVALYKDDLQEAAFDAGITYIRPIDQYRPILWETAAAYAGHGFGMCKHYKERMKCQKEEMSWPRLSMLAIHYSKKALTVSLTKVADAITIWEPDYRHVENFTLGSDAIAGYSSEEDYWSHVKDTLLIAMKTWKGFPRPKRIMVTGDMVEETFMNFMKETLTEYLGYFPVVFADDPVVVAAKGAAQFMRRGPADVQF